MIEIIKGGKKRFVLTCEVCDAEFSYEIDDVIGRTVRCPCCGEYCRHYSHNKMESEVAKRREDIEKSPVDCSTPSVTDSKGERNELY